MIRILRDEILERLVASERDRPAQSRSDEERPSGDHWSRVVLLERVAYLRQMARFGEGEASDLVRDCPCYSATLSVKLRSGDAETHAQSASLIIILDGVAQMVTGRANEGSTTLTSGEIDGPAIIGSNLQQVRSGDVVHIAAGTPYRFLLTGEKAISYLEIKIRTT